MSLAQQAGWIVRRGSSSEDAWRRCWCVVGPESLALFNSEDSHEAIAEYALLATTRIFDLSTPGVPIVAFEALSGRPHGFLLSIESNGDGRRLECFDPESERLREVWLEAIRAASTTPKQIEAYIDDFSDVEDDTHARRSSLESTDDLDWSQLDKVVKNKAKGGSFIECDGESVSATTSVREAESVSASISVKEAAIGGQDSDADDDDVGKRSSLEMKDNMDWSALQVSKARSRKSTAGSAASAGAGAGDGVVCEEAEHIDTEAAKPLSKNAMEAIYGECW